MDALRSRGGHYIFALWFLLLSFFPRLISGPKYWTVLPQVPKCLSPFLTTSVLAWSKNSICIIITLQNRRFIPQIKGNFAHCQVTTRENQESTFYTGPAALQVTTRPSGNCKSGLSHVQGQTLLDWCAHLSISLHKWPCTVAKMFRSSMANSQERVVSCHKTAWKCVVCKKTVRSHHDAYIGLCSAVKLLSAHCLNSILQ